MPEIEAAGAIVFSRDAEGELLVLVIRRARPPRRGAWTIPGGRVEPGESASDAARREVREETGVDVAVLAETELYALEPFVIHEHLCVPTESTLPAPVPGDDADDARWARLSELEALGVHGDARAVIARAAAIFSARAGA